MTLVILAELSIALLLGVVTVALYGVRSPWQDSPMGRHLMAFILVTTADAGLLLLLGLGVHVPLWLFAFAFGALDLVVLQRLWLLIKVQRGDST